MIILDSCLVINAGRAMFSLLSLCLFIMYKITFFSEDLLEQKVFSDSSMSSWGCWPIPHGFKAHDMKRSLDESGFGNTYDFLRIPTDAPYRPGCDRGQRRQGSNRGFCFVNFLDSDTAQRFYSMLNGTTDGLFSSVQPVRVGPAVVQGFEENVLRYIEACESSTGTPVRPLLLRRLPPHLAARLAGAGVHGAGVGRLSRRGRRL